MRALGEGHRGIGLRLGAVIAAAAASLMVMLAGAAAAHASCLPSTRLKPPKHRVLRVGTFNGKKGPCNTIQEAVDAATPGDWILIGPGDYKQSSSRDDPRRARATIARGADVLITTPNLHIRGMDRNTVMIDGTKPGSPQCSSAEADQTFGPPKAKAASATTASSSTRPSGVHLQNFSTCNFLGDNAGGDSIWFDGGGATGKQEIGSWWGEYLSSTSTYWGGTDKPSDEYGHLRLQHVSGPGCFIHTYANNMSDSGYYIGACPDCNSTINNGHAENNDLGYSGSNSGGHSMIENSEFNNNEEGVATQSQNNDDAPSPQDGVCPKARQTRSRRPGAQRKNICWVMIHNRVINNNNGATPTTDSAPGLARHRHDDRRRAQRPRRRQHVRRQQGVGPPARALPGRRRTRRRRFPPKTTAAAASKAGGGETYVCYYEAFANEIENNTFADNGGYGNPSNGDIGEVANPEPATRQLLARQRRGRRRRTEQRTRS